LAFDDVNAKEILSFMEGIFRDVCKEFQAELKEFNGEGDHVHLLVNYPPKVSISSLVNSLKGVSSRYVRQKQFPNLQKLLWMDSLWSPSYFAGSCGGAPLEVIKQYIDQQKTPH
jgi:putative transposase